MIGCIRTSLGGFAAAVLWPLPALAHGFGERFVLPLPLWLWMAGAGLTIATTFAILAIYVRRPVPPPVPAAARTEYPGEPEGPALRLVQGLVAAAFVLAVAAGLVGNQDPYANLLPTFVWVVWWVGAALVSALVVDFWALVNPLRTMFAWAEAAYRLFSGGRRLARNLRYPTKWAQWPAVALFLLFAWGELIWASNDVPRRLALACLAYAILTWVGMWAFGREEWQRRGDAFAVAFGVLGRFAPLSLDANTGRLHARMPGAALLVPPVQGASFVAFVLLMLASVTFDGFLQTPAFHAIVDRVYSSASAATLLIDLARFGISDLQIIMTVGLLIFPLLFVAAYWMASWTMARAAAQVDGRAYLVSTVAGAFVLTLVPIAVAYHVAHYFSLFATAGQLAIPLASDPFGWGWNVFGTRDYDVNISIISPYVLCYGAVALIVAGHVIAVYVAHRVALHLFASPRAAWVSQIPMMALMVAYTMSSLWILAQPIVS